MPGREGFKVPRAGILFLAVPDAAVSDMAARIAAAEPPSGLAVVHVSGALTLEALRALGNNPRGSFHPLQSFPTRRDPAFFEKFGAKNGQVRLLYVGRVSREKDLDLLAEAYRRLRNDGLSIQLCVVGHGPYSKEFAKALPEALFTGYLKGEELAAAYASADIFVFPSTTDTFGNVIIEAQASGVPVIVSDSGGPKELVENERNGLITKSHDVEDLTRAIRELVANPERRKQMGNLARESAHIALFVDAGGLRLKSLDQLGSGGGGDGGMPAQTS